MKCDAQREPLLLALDRTVADAVDFFRRADPDLRDGGQSAREALSHLVFWHCAYVGTAWALATGRTPPLFTGKFHELNALATQRFECDTMDCLCDMLAHRQKQLARALRRLPNWDVDFPIKEESVPVPVWHRLHQVEAHIRAHVTRLKRAAHQREREREMVRA